MRRARESLRGHWGIAVGGVLLYTVILSGVSAFFPCLGLIASLLITGPLVVGLNGLFLSLLRKRDAEIGQLFDGFKNFGTTCGAYLLMSLFIFLWSLLFIVPGIVASYRYAMTAYILADDPTVRAYEAIGRSAVMMRGRKWKLFCLYWRFFGWSLLCLLTCGIGYIWLAPYMQASVAHFYEDVRAGTAGNK